MTKLYCGCTPYSMFRRPGSQWRRLGSLAAVAAVALSLSDNAMAAANAETVIPTNSVLGTYLAARLAEQLRDTDAATGLLKIALERDPTNAALLDQAFISEVIGGNWSKGVAYATRAVTADPGNQIAHLVLGVDAFKAGRLGDAERHFTALGNAPAAIMAKAWVVNARRDFKGAAQLMSSISEPNWVGFFRRYQTALMADADGDSAAAGKIYEELFSADHGAINVALAYAKHASHLGDNKQASDILAKHLAAVSQHHPLVEAAVEALGRGDTLALEVSNSAEGLSDTLYGFSQVFQGQGGIDLALIYTQLALQLKPDDQLTLFSLAEIMEQLKKYDQAIAVYRRLPANSPLHFDASIHEGLNLNALDKTEEAKAALQALAEPAKTVDTSAMKAGPALHSAIEALAGVSIHERGDKIIALQTLLARAGYSVGALDGKYGAATRDAVAHLQMDAGLSQDGAFNPATRKALEDHIGAMAVPSAATLPNERLVDLYTTIGNMLRGRKQFADAVEDYGKAIALIGAPTKPAWDQYYSRAVCYERLNQWSKAEPDFLKAMELNPDEPLILNYLGYSWVDRNEHVEKALELIKKAVSLKPEDGYYVDSLGWAYFRMGRYDDAVQQLEHAVELNAGDPTINDHLGDAYWRAGRKLEAQFQWSTSLSSKPEPEDVPRIQEKLKNGLPPESAPATAAVKPADSSGTDKTKLP